MIIKNLPPGSLKALFLSLLFDAIGMLSYFIPGYGEFIDIIWAPLAGIIHFQMYGNRAMASLSFLEEILPGTDLLPTFTLTWVLLKFNFLKPNENP
ncbi:hypothetical protein [Persicobacter diffluens]|uniref:Uncharacterized protein n=1 Tax=Persicobacter diffluens TaxID=981 RepID=A0AAN4W3K6_9BACT|nr:hypothetical protein PEDI_38870 [Persicobacter diffluens]